MNDGQDSTLGLFIAVYIGIIGLLFAPGLLAAPRSETAGSVGSAIDPLPQWPVLAPTAPSSPGAARRTTTADAAR